MKTGISCDILRRILGHDTKGPYLEEYLLYVCIYKTR